MHGLKRTGLLFLVLLASLGTWETQAFGQARYSNRVYIFRGAAGYWPGVNDMAEKVRQQGFEPVICRSVQNYWMKSQIAQRRKSGEETGPMLIIGYSLGAETAVKLAEALGKEGIQVDGLLLIEPYNYPKIPPNVEYCFNIFESRPSDRWFVFRGTPVSQVTSATSFLQVDIAKDPKFTAEFGFLNHFNVEDDPRLQNLVAGQLPGIKAPPNYSPAIVQRAPSQPVGNPRTAPNQRTITGLTSTATSHR